ncbi:MAG: GTP-binding protein [Firmicutes bacterium]|nr:GTP-binding protein [Bacillota bacterium]
MVALVGSPNVGKSVIFNYLTGGRVQVANYPGTTVEVARGKMIWAGVSLEIVDTPGIYSLLPITAEEQVTRRLLWTEKPALTVHVVDAKNLERMLPLSFQILEAGLPMLLTLNMMDEARRLGLSFNVSALERALGVEVILAASIRGEGLPELRERVIKYVAGL